MKQGFRQSMAWLHTWTGLLVGWLLLLIFMAGTASYYRQEISRWMRPELPTTTTDTLNALRTAERYLRAHAGDAQSWHINLPSAREPTMALYWRNPEPPPGQPVKRDDLYGNANIDPSSSGDITVRDTRGGEFFYRLHFDLHYLPVIWARYLVGFCAMFMLVAIITGVITHKKIFKDFFTFRPGKGQRSWLDFHNVSAVLALPYHAMITYTGIVTLMLMYLPWGIKAVYHDDAQRFYAEAFNLSSGSSQSAAGVTAALLPLDRLADSARKQWQGVELASVVVNYPGDANATVQLTQRSAGLSVHTPYLLYSGVDGQLLARSKESGGATQTRGVMYGLHIARFAQPGLRLLFFASGLLGCLMIASGVVLWAIKERPKHLKAGRIGFGLRLVDSLNIGTVAGLPIAFASYFWGNRLLPVQLQARADAEVSVFFWAWAAALLAAFIWPKRSMWAWQLYIGAMLFAGVPLLNAITSDIHLLRTLPAGNWSLAGVDLVCLALGLCLGLAGWRMQHWQPPLSAAERRARQAAAPPVGQRMVATQEGA